MTSTPVTSVTHSLATFIDQLKEDYNFSRAEVADLIARVSAEVGAPAGASQQLERFIDAPQDVGIDVVLDLFATMRQQDHK